MNIAAEFIKGVTGTNEILYDGKFQVAFIGRSNVGKSSLINSLLMKRNLARSSSNPGKTIRLDFFLINRKFYFVDLPGYGYSKVSAKRQNKLREMILWYFLYSGIKERMAILVIDAKVGLTDLDREMIDILKKNKVNFIIVANKIDKLKMGEKEKQLKKIQDECGFSKIIPYSSIAKEGRKELMKMIFN
jgi:GTP-binding protein